MIFFDLLTVWHRAVLTCRVQKMRNNRRSGRAQMNCKINLNIFHALLNLSEN